ncbi:MAG TPA: hemerythrin domain-containing protein [Ramlibacter sp.]|nr:hemerythrin domain-containing protein [Ramlibacter sp.]
MTANPADQGPVDHEAPLNSFSQCHAGILSQLETLAGLPALIEAAARARSVAASTLALFQHGMAAHHNDEESLLFPAVLRSADAGVERERVQAVVERLTGEHRTLEALWKRIEPSLNATAKGRPAEVDTDIVSELVRAYTIHARFEEEELLPLAQVILSRNGNHMAALGLSLHMRPQLS